MLKVKKKSNGPRSPESLWRRSEVRFLMGTQNYLLHPRSRQDEKLDIFLYFFNELKTHHLSCSIYKTTYCTIPK